MQDTGCKKLIMAGIVLDVCVVFPALAALAEGYEVRQCIKLAPVGSEHDIQRTQHAILISQHSPQPTTDANQTSSRLACTYTS